MGSVFSHPMAGLAFILGALGSPLASDVNGATAAGAIVLLGALVLAWGALRGRVALLPLAPTLALVLFGVGAAFMLALGRGGFGPESAVASRYVTLTVPGVVGLYLGALGVEELRLRSAALGAAAVLVCLGLFASLEGADAAGEAYSAARRADAALVRDIGHHSDAEVLDMYGTPGVVRERAAILLRYRLNVFAGP